MKSNKKKNYNNVYGVRPRTQDELMKHKEIHRKHGVSYYNAFYPPYRMRRMITYTMLIKRVYAVHGLDWTYEPIE